MRYLIIFLGLLLIPSAASAQDVSPRCEAAIDRAAGHYSQCLLSADASYARHGNPTKLANRQARCETRFERRTSRAFSRYGADECTSAELVAALADRTVTCAEGVATEAGGKAAASRLYVQVSAGGSLTGTTLTLSDIDESTGWFTDRPYRDAGRMTTAEFVALFSEEGPNSFATDPPNADFTCESDGKVVDQEVVLTEPTLDEATNTLTYTVSLVSAEGGGDSFTGISCESGTNLFIDSEETTSVCRSSYKCFIGGFCSTAAANSIPSVPASFFTNVYAGDTPASGIPFDLGCGVENSDYGAWSNGVSFFNSLMTLSDDSTDPDCQQDPQFPQPFPCSSVMAVVGMCGVWHD